MKIVLTDIPEWIFFLFLVLFLFGGSANANIYMDEDFEGAEPFVNRNFPVLGDTAQPVQPLLTGLNLRAWSSGYTSPTVELIHEGGTVISVRSYAGTHSYKLSSGQKLAVSPGAFPFRNGNWFRVWQFAINTDSNTTNLTSGTQVGFFKIDYSNDSITDLTPDVTIKLKLKVNDTGNVDLVCENKSNTIIGTLNGGLDSWLLVTIIAMNKVTTGDRLESTEGWAAYDFFTDTYKGPQPIDPDNPTKPLISTGIHIYVNNDPASLTLTRATELGSDWGNEVSGTQVTSEIGWEFAAENGGNIYLDNLYWDAGLHQEFPRGMDREQAARLAQFAGGPIPSLLPGIDSSIKRVYMVSHAHLDIGFTKPPEVVAEQYKTMIDAQIQFAAPRPDYKWTIEETWMLEQWLKRSTQQEINQLVGLVNSGQISVAGGHSTMHSARLGVEEMNRLLWNAGRYRHLYDFKIETVFHDDVPAVSWYYPQVLARSDIKYLVSGQNLFIGGGITQPYSSYLFRWEGPDGSRILTWSARESYAQGVEIFWWTSSVNETKLAAAMKDLTDAGYPYDAVMIQTAFDNTAGTIPYNNANKWNNTHENPLIVVATAEDFFEYMEEKYGSQIPVRDGNWVSNWDTGGNEAPREKKIAKNSQNLLPIAEQMNALANNLELGDYNSPLFDIGWDHILQIDEHTGPGGCWSDYWTQEEVDAANEQYRQYALDALETTSTTLATGIDNLLNAAADPTNDSLVVYNPLSWMRTDLARIPIPPDLFDKDFTLHDAASGMEVELQKDAASSSVLFIAENVPSIGFKRYIINYSAAARTPSAINAESRIMENDLFLVELDEWGYVSRLYDKIAEREIVDSSDAFQFNRMIQGTNLQWFFSVYDIVPDPAVPPSITVNKNGPVATSLRIERANHPHARGEIILYKGLNRVDFINTPDRDDMLYAALGDNSRSYGLSFPFNLTGAQVRIDTAAGWCNPATDMIEGSYRAAFAIQNCLDLSEANYGISFSTPDVYIHSLGGFQGYNPPSPVNPTVVSTFIRYGDEADLVGTDIGYVVDEPGAPPQWDIQYSIRPHTRAFDPVLEARFGWEVCAPLQGKLVPSSKGANIKGDAVSFLSIDAANIMITSIKKADFNNGLIVKFQEIADENLTTATLTSDILRFDYVQPVTPLESDIGMPLLESKSSEPVKQNVQITMKAREISCVRILASLIPAIGTSLWMFY